MLQENTHVATVKHPNLEKIQIYAGDTGGPWNVKSFNLLETVFI